MKLFYSDSQPRYVHFYLNKYRLTIVPNHSQPNKFYIVEQHSNSLPNNPCHKEQLHNCIKNMDHHPKSALNLYKLSHSHLSVYRGQKTVYSYEYVLYYESEDDAMPAFIRINGEGLKDAIVPVKDFRGVEYSQTVPAPYDGLVDRTSYKDRGFPAIELFRQGCGRGIPRPYPSVTRLCGSPPRTAGGTGGSASHPPASASCRCGL